MRSAFTRLFAVTSRHRLLTSLLLFTMAGFPLTTTTLATPPATTATKSLPPPSDDLIGRAVISPGDARKLHQLFAKAGRGEPITLGFIGGSITEGAKASDREHRWVDLTADWFRAKFPSTKFTLVNAGIGATGSPYGCLRVQRDLLSKRPDFVVIDFGVNDGPERWMADTYEGVVRQILEQPNDPAIMEIFFMHADGGNAQTLQAKIGEHYGIPCVSYRDALWPTIQSGQAAWADYSPDDVHPNDWGHAFAAKTLIRVLDGALTSMPANVVSEKVAAAPPLFSDAFTKTKLLEGPALVPQTNDGWSYEAASGAWVATRPGSVITFEVEGTSVFTMFYRLRGDFGRASLSIDGRFVTNLDGWFAGTWGGYRDIDVQRDLKPGSHTVRLELLEDKDPLSTGHQFRLLGLGVGGVGP